MDDKDIPGSQPAPGRKPTDRETAPPTQNISDSRIPAPDTFIPTGVPGLDVILGGGLARGALTLIVGVPGSGKTTLASQIALNATRIGKRAVILTSLSESTSKLLEHLASYSFFDPALVGDVAQFFSLDATLQQGVKAVGDLIITEARRIKADVVMLDGFRALSAMGSGPLDGRDFLYSLGTTLGALGVTSVVTSEMDPHDTAFFPETTTADIILGLHYKLFGVQHQRGIEVIKARGAQPVPGLHALTLSVDGARVFSQLEERVIAETNLSAPANAPAPGGKTDRAPGQEPSHRRTRLDSRASFDLPELDAMLQGGIPRTSCTILAGSLGTGKTLLSLQFAMAGVRAGERTVFLSFREDRDQLARVTAPFAIGPEFVRALQSDVGLDLLEVPPIKINADILADFLLAQLDQTGAVRLIIDSIADFERMILHGPDPKRLEDYLAAFLRALRVRQVTALLVKETDKLIAPTLDFSADPLSILAENVIVLQQVPFEGELHRVLSIPKVRLSAHDTTLREFRIAEPGGLIVLGPFDSQAGVLEGISRAQNQSRPPSQRDTLPHSSNNSSFQPVRPRAGEKRSRLGRRSEES
ncbi:MAG TPA: ATPase domain-containing protein [Ktedonobacterales bacterium]|nr:ATPase domain-containing protein [Ktedonobacterales bacterium]